jgi:hypothetical protein
VIERRLDTNSDPVAEDADQIKAGDYIQGISTLTDSNDTVYRFYIDENRFAYYDSHSLEPDYYIKGGEVYLDSHAHVKLNPRRVNPGIFRDLDYPIKGQDRNSMFNDRSDILLVDIMVDQNGQLRYKAQGESEYSRIYQSEVWLDRIEAMQEFIDTVEGFAAEREA